MVLTPDRRPARARTIPCTRDLVQPGTHWPGIRRSSSSHRRLYQSCGPGSTEESFLQHRPQRWQHPNSRYDLSCLSGAVLMSELGYGDRLLNEVKRLALKDVKIKIYAPPERKYSTWIGGSILAGLNAFKKVRSPFSFPLARSSHSNM
jgi:hypothetical protein